MAEAWAVLVRQGGQALVEGRFSEGERLAAEAAVLAPGEVGPAFLAVVVRRERGRAAEGEAMARELVAAHPEAPEAQALLGAVLADLGRDAEAGRQLDLLGGADAVPVAAPVAAFAAEVAAVLQLADRAEALYGVLLPHADAFAPACGALARHLGLLGHVLDRWDDAEAHFDRAVRLNQAAGAPVLLAHTRRQYSALLRARGRNGDWERAIDLLAEAAMVYRRLEIDRLAEEAEAVLRRSQDLDAGSDGPGDLDVFRPAAGGGWELSYGGAHAVVPATAGLAHIATLLASSGRPVHAVDLAAGPAGLVDQVAAEYGSRVAELDAQLAGVAPDPVSAALARSERDFLQAELAVLSARAPSPGEVGDRARRLVALRVRTTLDQVEQVLPDLARHLRRAIRTGTFCLYEPDRPRRWKIGP